MTVLWLSNSDHDTVLRILAQPGAKKNEIIGIQGDRLKIKIAAPPVDDKANEELVFFLSKTLDIRRSEIEIIRGQKARTKDIRIHRVINQDLLQPGL